MSSARAAEGPGGAAGLATGRALWSSRCAAHSGASGALAIARPRPVSRRPSVSRAPSISRSSSGLVTLNEVRPATYLGTGKVDEFAGLVKTHDAGVVVMDCPLSPVQQRNLEKAWGAKVIDRTGLILEIFGRRARTREGALQVEHAHLTYQKSRLVRSWTHLERQRGGFGFLGGPGETQLEADRRVIEDRIKQASRANSTRSSAPASCTATAAAACRIRSPPWSATPMPASRRCSTA